MQLASTYGKEARSCTRAAFCGHFAHLFLVKHPSTAVERSLPKAEFDFATTTIDMSVDPIPEVMQIAEVKKREGNPFPDRLSIGRAPNCDVVLRLPLVSKVHAHLLVQPEGGFALRDNKASNGTFHNDKLVQAGDCPRVVVGDTLGFGSLKLQLVDAGQLYSILNSSTAPNP